jgi:ethanolamine utilization microcompartment shell protein EutL
MSRAILPGLALALVVAAPAGVASAASTGVRAAELTVQLEGV